MVTTEMDIVYDQVEKRTITMTIVYGYDRMVLV